MDILDEHQPAPTDTKGNTYEPSLKDRQAIKLNESVFQKAKRHKAQYDARWPDYYKMFRGKQWNKERPSYRHSEVINLIFQQIQSSVPLLTDIKPRFSFLPQDPSDREFAEFLSDMAASDWERNNWSEVLLEVIYDGAFYGAGFSNMRYDPDKDFGLGGIEYKSVDPFHLFPEPNAKDINRECEGITIAEPMDVMLIKKQHPKHADFIKPDMVDLLQGTKTDLQNYRIRSSLDRQLIVETQDGSENSQIHKDQALLVTSFIRCYDFDEEEKQRSLEDGQVETYYEQKLRYPNGRLLITCNSILLEDRALEEHEREYPFQRYVNYILPREFWGISDVEQLEGPQKIFNKLISFALDVLTLMGNPIWIVSNDSDVDTDSLYSRPGLIVEKNPNSEVRREEGVQLQPFVLQIVDRIKGYVDDIGGNQDVSHGVNPSGVTAASAIENLQQAAQTRIRQKSRNLDNYLQQVGQQYANLVMNHYTAPRIMRITGRDGAERYFKVHITDVETEDGIVKQATVQAHTGSGWSDQFNVYTLRGMFDVKVSTGSSLPFNKAQKKDELMALYDRGIVDDVEVLKGIDYPNADAVLDRVAKRKQAEMEAQLAAKQGGQPPPAGP